MDVSRALHYYDLAGLELPAAKRKAVLLREQLAQAQARKQRLALEAKAPERFDANCPNCGALLDLTSAKCKPCGAVFGISDEGWKPVPRAHLRPDAPSRPSPAPGLAVANAAAGDGKKSGKKSTIGLGKIFLWTGHFCLVASLSAYLLGQTSSGATRLIFVAPFFYGLWMVGKVVSAGRRFLRSRMST